MAAEIRVLEQVKYPGEKTPFQTGDDFGEVDKNCFYGWDLTKARLIFGVAKIGPQIQESYGSRAKFKVVCGGHKTELYAYPFDGKEYTFIRIDYNVTQEGKFRLKNGVLHHTDGNESFKTAAFRLIAGR